MDGKFIYVHFHNAIAALLFRIVYYICLTVAAQHVYNDAATNRCICNVKTVVKTAVERQPLSAA